MGNKKIDIIVAVRDEEGNIPVFVKEVRKLYLPKKCKVGIIFVEDSSTDNTVLALRKVSSKDIRYFSLRKGYGQTAALAFGLSNSTADAIITMDIDGGHPLEAVGPMIRLYLQGADVVQGVRKCYQPSLFRRIGSEIFNNLFYIITGSDIRKQNVYFRLVSEEICKEMLRDNRGLHFLRLNFDRLHNKKIRYVRFRWKNRNEGASKYSVIRLARFAVDAILSIIPLWRFMILIALFSMISLLLILVGWESFGAVLFMLIMVVTARMVYLSKDNVLAKLRVKETNGDC